MKQKLKKLTKLGILLLGVSLFLTNCEQDSLEHSNRQAPQSPPFKTSRVTKNAIEQNQTLTKTIQLLKNELVKNKSNIKNKTVYSNEYDFTIETDFATYIENEDGTYHSYTFPIMRTISNGLLENLLLSLQEDGTYKTYIVSYDLSEQEQEDISNEIQINLKNRATFTEIDAKNLTSDIFRNKMDACGYNSEVICWEVACEIDGCWDSQYTTTECDTILIYVDCSDGGGGGIGTGEGGNTSGNNGSDGHGGGRNGSGTSNSDVTTPTLCENCPSIEDFLEELLNNAIADNPFLLLEIDCNQIKNWQTLAQHTAPQNVQNKIDNLPSTFFNSFEIQPLDEANGTVVNLDYFSVNITSLPNNPSTNQQFTADEFLDYIRKNFNDFVDDSTFEPFCKIASMCQTETDLWNSNNPLGSIIYIDIPFDDGVVVCTEYTNNYWYFMTMNAPYAGNHPVSGTRQFGYEQNANGSYNFFVRGVDRFDSNIVENASYGLDGFDNAFQGADDLWESFQNKTKDFVNNNSGAASIITPVKNRPDWDKVQQVLNGDLPISELGCD